MIIILMTIIMIIMNARVNSEESRVQFGPFSRVIRLALSAHRSSGRVVYFRGLVPEGPPEVDSIFAGILHGVSILRQNASLEMVSLGFIFKMAGFGKCLSESEASVMGHGRFPTQDIFIYPSLCMHTYIYIYIYIIYIYIYMYTHMRTYPEVSIEKSPGKS